MTHIDLPVATPPINGYQFYAFPLSILAAHPQSLDWVFSNYIQLCFDRNFPTSPVPFAFFVYDYTISPWLEVRKLDRTSLKWTGVSIDVFVLQALQANNYVYLNLDELHIPWRPRYQKRHYSHDFLVTGYRPEEDTFVALGFNAQAQWGQWTIPRSQFIAAYESLDDMDNPCQQVILYAFKSNAQYALNLPLILRGLQEYLDSTNTSRQYEMLMEPWDRAYGMESYQVFAEYLELLVAGKIHFDQKYWHTLYEHKKCMRMRFEHIERAHPGTFTDVLPELQTLEEQCQSFRNYCLFANHKKKTLSRDYLLDKLTAIEQADRNLTARLIQQLHLLLEPTVVSLNQ